MTNPAYHSGRGKEPELAARLRPDVVLMDLSMPEMDGFEATREILTDVLERRGASGGELRAIRQSRPA